MTTREYLSSSEHPARDYLPLDAGKPDVDLLQPGGGSWSEVELHLGMLVEELLDLFGLVGREVVQDDMDFPFALGLADRVFQKADELLTGVAGGRPAMHLAGLHVQGCVQRQGAVAVGLESMPLQPPGRQRQHRV